MIQENDIYLAVKNFIDNRVELGHEIVEALKERCSKNPRDQLTNIVHHVTQASSYPYSQCLADAIISEYFFDV